MQSINAKTPPKQKEFKLTKMKHIVIVFLVIVSCTNYDRTTNNENVFAKATIQDSLSFYFPAVLNDTIERKHSEYDNFEQKWYSTSLYSFKVPILYNKNDSQTIYRLLWLRSFHQPVCFSMEEFKGEYFLNAKALDRQPAFLPVYLNRKRKILDTTQKADRLALIAFDTTINVRKIQWNEIENYLSKLDFWNSPIADPADEHTSDGSNWIIEGRKNNKYHFINRRNARGDLMNFGKYLIKLSAIKISEDAIY